MAQRNLGRRRFLQASAIAPALASASARGGPAEGNSPRKPNFIYILLDDAGYGDLGCYGQALFKTPNIDRLAREGVRFTDHYAGSAVCAPSRCSLLTGLHTGHCYIRGNREMWPEEGQEPLPSGAVTLPRLLKEAGYVTGMFGKWGLGYPGSSGDPLEQGFGEFFGYNCQRQAHNYYPDHLWHNREKVPLDGKTYSHDLIMDRALDFIRENREGPFFCYLPVTIPHASMHVPEESAKPFRREFWKHELTPGIYAGPVIRNPAACFAGMMTRLDRQIGELVELVDGLGLAGDTCIMLSSDNGPHKEGGHRPGLFDSNGPFRGFKRDLYEGGIRVPMIARRPGAIEPGQVTGHVSAFWDVLPTLCELAGIEAPGDIDGLSFAPVLDGRAGEQKRHDYLYWELPELGGRQAARAGKWKAVRYRVSRGPDGPAELYDLESDPGETEDLAEREPEQAARMAEILRTARTESDLFKLFE